MREERIPKTLIGWGLAPPRNKPEENNGGKFRTGKVKKGGEDKSKPPVMDLWGGGKVRQAARLRSLTKPNEEEGKARFIGGEQNSNLMYLCQGFLCGST